MKPHLFFLLFIAAAVAAVRAREVLLPLLICFVLLLLLLGCECISPGITKAWIAASRLGVDDLRVLRSANVPAFLGLTYGGGREVPLWILSAVPAAAAVSYSLWLLRSRQRSSGSSILIAVPLSLIFAPYAWHHDFAILVPVIAGSLAAVAGTEREKTVIRLLFAVNFLAIIQMWVAFRYVMEYLWIPIAVFGIVIVALLKRPERAFGEGEC